MAYESLSGVNSVSRNWKADPIVPESSDFPGSGLIRRTASVHVLDVSVCFMLFSAVFVCSLPRPFRPDYTPLAIIDSSGHN